EDLPSQRREVWAMLVPDPGRRLIDDRVAGLEYFVEEISIFADTGRHAGPELLAHQTDARVAEDGSPEGCVGSGAERPGRHRCPTSPEPLSIYDPPPVAAPQSTVSLKKSLRPGLKAQRENVPRYNHHIEIDERVQ